MTADDNGSSTGRYYSPMPIDFTLLEIMPEVGMIGGVHWKGKRAKDMRQELIDSGVDAALVPMPFIAARLRSMNVAGLITTYRASTSQIWARNTKGTEFLGTRDEVLGGTA